MDLRIYDPEVAASWVVNTYDDPAGLTYAANPSLTRWEGFFYLAFDGTPSGLTEGGGGSQRIWMKKATTIEGLKSAVAFQPFRDAAYCNNPFGGSATEWQPSLAVIDHKLACLWSGADSYISILESPTGKWTTSRFEFLGEQPSLSSTLTGAGTGGRSRRVTVDGITDWLLFPSGDPTPLSTGVVAWPATIYSQASVSTQVVTSNTFTKALKYNVVLTTVDGVEWTLARIPTGTFGDYSAWEPFITESPVGQLCAFFRNLNPAVDPKDAQLVSRSSDSGKSFSPPAPTRMQVPQSRGAAVRVSANRWFMLHCDRAADPNFPSGSGGRENGTLFTSLKGIDDFVPGVSFTPDGDQWVKYPQGLRVGDDLHVAYTSGHSTGAAGGGRVGIRVATISPLPDDDAAYIHPRNASRALSFSDPNVVAGTPAYYNFDGYNRMLSAATVTPSAGLSYVAWLKNPIDPPVTAAIIDTRSGLTGSIFRVNGVDLRSMDIYHGWDLPLDKALFLAASIDNTAMTVTFYTAYGQNDFVTKTSYFKSILFSGQPLNNETITINSVVYTFKTSASVTNEIQIGASAAATCANLKAAVETAMAASGSNETSNLILDTRLIVTRPDGATFAASTSATNVTVESSVSLTAGNAYVGSSIPGSSVPSYRGQLYDARIYDATLTAANMRSLYNARAAEFGYSTISGTSTTPSGPLLRVNPASPDNSAWPLVGGAHCYEIVDDLLRLHGEASAAVDQPFGATDVTIRYKLSDTPASTDKYVIASFGVASSPVRLYINGANPKNLYLNGILVGTVTDPTAWNTITVTVSTNKAIVGGVDYYFEGKPRCYLGNAWPESLLDASKSSDYDVPAMAVSRA